VSRLAPARIRRFEGGYLGVDWSDGNRTVLPNRWLRGQCPCARSVDEWTGVRAVGEADVPFDVEPAKVVSVGRYALRIDWTDGHDSGIYGYEYLRELSARFAEGSGAKGGEPACGSKAGHLHA